jgi:hypothetical protein
MKTTQFLTAILVMATLSFGRVNASENTLTANATKNLSEQIQKAFNTTPFEDLINLPTERITVIFKINENHEFELVQVLGKNRELTQYSKMVLSKKRIKVDPNMESKAYYIPLTFVCK